MKQRLLIRQLRKQSLQLRAQGHRLALREDLHALRAPFTNDAEEAGGIQWLAISGTLLNVLAAGKMGRWASVLNIGLLSWQLLRKVLARSKSPPADKI